MDKKKLTIDANTLIVVIAWFVVCAVFLPTIMEGIVEWKLAVCIEWAVAIIGAIVLWALSIYGLRKPRHEEKNGI